MVAFGVILPTVTISEKPQVECWLCRGRDDGWFLSSLVPLWERTTRGGHSTDGIKVEGVTVMEKGQTLTRALPRLGDGGVLL